MSPYHVPATADKLKGSYRTARETLEGIAKQEIIIFSDNPWKREGDIQRLVEHEVMAEGYIRSFRNQQMAKANLYDLIKENIPKHAKSIEDALTSVGYEKEEIEGNTVYTRENGENLEILADARLDLRGKPAGVCLYHVPLDYTGDDPLGPVCEEKRMYKKRCIAGTVGFIGIFTATLVGTVLLDPPVLALLGLVPSVLSGIYALINVDAYNETSDHEPAFTGKQALVQAIKPTAEHARIMNPHAKEEIKEQTLRPRFKDYMHMDVIDFLRGERPKVRIEIEEEEELVEVEERAKAEAERHK